MVALPGIFSTRFFRFVSPVLMTVTPATLMVDVFHAALKISGSSTV